MVVLTALLAAAAPASAVAPVPCPGVRFLLGETLVPGATQPFDVITIDAAGNAAIASGCAATPARTVRRRGGGGFRARWLACGGLENVRLRTRVDMPGCSTLTATFSARGLRRREIVAGASACGDGRIDPAIGEECESAADCVGEPCTGCACGTEPPTTTSTSPSTTTTTSTVPTGTTGGGLFEAPNAWTVDVSGMPKSPSSDGIIQALSAAGGWGAGSFRIDFSIEVLEADASTPFRSFTPTGDFYTPDCDHVPFPVPPGGALEGENGYQCVSDGDCHLIVVHRPTKKLYEMWRANITVGGTFTGGCAAVWDLTRSYGDTLRGDQCTSADAGGFPMAAMLFSADEVAGGSIDHAIRFVLPNSRMRSGVYVRPASHAGGPSGGASLPPYGVRFRLRGDFPLASLPSEGARVVARALQRYGMILSDGGNIALTARSDRFTAHSWAEVGIDTRSLSAIQVSDMEVVGLGPTIPLTYDCVRTP